MEQKREYIAPQLTIVRFHTEQGYTSSLNLVLLCSLSYDSEQMEAYSTGNDWTAGNDTFWN